MGASGDVSYRQTVNIAYEDAETITVTLDAAASQRIPTQKHNFQVMLKLDSIIRIITSIYLTD